MRTEERTIASHDMEGCSGDMEWEAREGKSGCLSADFFVYLVKWVDEHCDLAI